MIAQLRDRKVLPRSQSTSPVPVINLALPGDQKSQDDYTNFLKNNMNLGITLDVEWILHPPEDAPRRRPPRTGPVIV
jgi:hypothetical protein